MNVSECGGKISNYPKDRKTVAHKKGYSVGLFNCRRKNGNLSVASSLLHTPRILYLYDFHDEDRKEKGGKVPFLFISTNGLASRATLCHPRGKVTMMHVSGSKGQQPRQTSGNKCPKTCKGWTGDREWPRMHIRILGASCYVLLLYINKFLCSVTFVQTLIFVFI